MIPLTPLRAVLVSVVFVAGAAHAQQKPDPVADGYPTRPVRLLVGNAPGGGIDITARAVAQKLSERWGRSLVVDNRPGGAGLIAIDLAAQAAADGHTLLVTSGSLIGSATAQKKLAYDTRKAFAPVTQLATLCYLLMVNPSLPVRSVKELIAYAKSRPNALSYGSSGVGGAGHLAAELLSSMAGVKMVHVPYKGGGQVLIDLIAGQVQLGFTATISGMPHVRSGKLRALAVTSARRAQAFPELPTLSESGLPGYELINWYGLFAPAGTPPAIVAMLHREVGQALASPDVHAMLAKDGAEAAGSASPAEFRASFFKEVESWEKIVRMPAFAESLR